MKVKIAHIIFEITEDVLMGNIEMIAKHYFQILAIGVAIVAEHNPN